MSQSAPSTGRLKLGEMLVEAGVISQDKLDAALAEHGKSGMRLGEFLVASGFVSESTLTQTLANQLSVPWVSLSQVKFTRELLDMVPPETAQSQCLIPVYLRTRRTSHKSDSTKEKVLYVAMADPTRTDVLVSLASTLGMEVRAMVAVPTDVRNAVELCYYSNTKPPPPVPRARRSSASLAPPPPLPQVSNKLAPGAQPDPHVKNEQSVPAASRRTRTKSVTLTLLDGTKVSLPVAQDPSSSIEQRAEHEVPTKVEEVVRLLRARRPQAHDGTYASALTHWEPLLANLLEVLQKKGLISDDDLVGLITSEPKSK